MSVNPSDRSRTAAGSTGASVGDKVKGVFQTVHGVGESLRGGAMDFVDSATGTGGAHQETAKGAREAEEGIARMDHSTTAPAAGTGTTTSSATTSTANPTGVPSQIRQI